MMIPSISTFPAEAISRLTGVFFDIDDTFSSEGKILPGAYTALWQLKEAG